MVSPGSDPTLPQAAERLGRDVHPPRARGFVAGAVGAAVLGLGVPYGTMVVRGSYMDLDFSTPGAIFLFFVLSGGLNALLHRLVPKLALSTGELAVAYIMMVVACAVPTMGLTAQLLPIITAPYYYATPENRWEELIVPHLRPWLSPQSSFAISRFYEGLKAGEHIPWGAWLTPLVHWLPFLLALHITGICAMVLLRAQWAGRERLAYPLVQLPTELARARAGLPERSILRSPALWIGFALPFAVGSLIGLRAYVPSMPSVKLDWSFPCWRNTLSLILRISFPMIGFFYLANTEAVFSLWFFNLLSWVARGEMNILGVEYREDLGIYGSPSPIFAHLGMGAITALVLSGLWTARRHLSAAVRRALGRPGGADDSEEVLPYRAALLGIGGGVVFMGWWLVAAGIPPLPMALFLVWALILFVGLTRIVVESGMAEAVAASISAGASVSAIGSGAFGSGGLVALAANYVWSADIRTFVTASAANGLRMADLTTGTRRPIFWAMLAAVCIAIGSSVWITLVMAYRHGGVNLNSWFFQGGPVAPYNWAASKIANPTPPNVSGWLLTGAGAAFTAFLALMRQRYVWWPFHPVGFTVGTTWIMDQIWLSAFIAWLLKVLIVRYGGLRGFRMLRPAFLGLVLGQFTCSGMWLVIDALTGQRGNTIFWI